MKKVLAVIVSVLFVLSVTGMCFAQAAAPAAKPADTKAAPAVDDKAKADKAKADKKAADKKAKKAKRAEKSEKTVEKYKEGQKAPEKQVKP